MRKSLRLVDSGSVASGPSSSVSSPHLPVPGARPFWRSQRCEQQAAPSVHSPPAGAPVVASPGKSTAPPAAACACISRITGGLEPRTSSAFTGSEAYAALLLAVTCLQLEAKATALNTTSPTGSWRSWKRVEAPVVTSSLVSKVELPLTVTSMQRTSSGALVIASVVSALFSAVFGAFEQPCAATSHAKPYPTPLTTPGIRFMLRTLPARTASRYRIKVGRTDARLTEGERDAHPRLCAGDRAVRNAQPARCSRDIT